MASATSQQPSMPSPTRPSTGSEKNTKTATLSPNPFERATPATPPSVTPQGSSSDFTPSSKAVASKASPTPSKTSTASPSCPVSPLNASWLQATASQPKVTGKQPPSSGR